MTDTTLTLGEHTFNLRLDMTAISDIQEHAGVDLLNGGPEAQARLQEPSIIRTALWAFCGGEDTGKTPRQFGRLLTIEHLPLAVAAITGMFARDAAEPDGDERPAGKAKAASR